MVTKLTHWQRCRLLDDYVGVNEGTDVDSDADKWEDVEAAELKAADEADHTVHANPLPAEQAAPAVSATAAPFTTALIGFLDVKHAAPTEAEQAKPAAAKQADQAQVGAAMKAPPRGGLAASVFRRCCQLYKASWLLLSKCLPHAAEELPLLPQDDVHDGCMRQAVY